MNIKRFFVVFLLLVAMILVVGCGGHRTAELDTTQPGRTKYKESNWSLFGPYSTPLEMGQADLMSAMAKNIRDGSGQPVATSGKILGVVENRSTSARTITVFFPEGGQIDVRPGHFVFIPSSKVPAEITIFAQGDTETHTYSVDNSPQVYMGQQVMWKYWFNVSSN